MINWNHKKNLTSNGITTQRIFEEFQNAPMQTRNIEIVFTTQHSTD